MRVSTDIQAQEGVSLDAQREKLRAYCKLHEIELIGICCDEGLSASTLDRHGLQSALKMLESGKADTLLVVKLDRLTRSLLDLDTLVRRFSTEQRFHLLSVTESLDRRTAMGRFVLYILGLAEEAFIRLCRRLNLGAAAEELKVTAEAMFRGRGAQLGAAVAAASFVGGELDPDELARALGILTSMDPSGAALRQYQDVRAVAVSVAAAAAAIAAVGTGHAKLLPIIGQAYVSTYGAVLERDGDPAPLRDKAVQLGKQLGLGEYQTGTYVDELRSTIDGEFGKAKKKAT